VGGVAGAVITSQRALADEPGNVRVANTDSGLPKPSVVNVSQLLTIDRTLLVERLRALPAPVMERVHRGLRLSLGI
jgi:mRNA interferase MazF